MGRARGRSALALGAPSGAHFTRGRPNCLSRPSTRWSKPTSPRAWAFALIGIHEYFRRMSGDRLMNQHRDTLTARLDRIIRTERDRRLALVRADGHVRQCEIAARANSQRAVDEQPAGDRNRSAHAALVGRRAASAGGSFSPDWLRWIFTRRATAGPVRSTAARSAIDGFGGDRGVSGDQRPFWLDAGEVGFRVVYGPQRPWSAGVRRQLWRHVATDCTPIASIRTKEPNRPWLICWHLLKCSCWKARLAGHSHGTQFSNC